MSSGGSNGVGDELGEDFSWGAETEDRSGSVVAFVGDRVEVGLVVGDVDAFGQVLADQVLGRRHLRGSHRSTPWR